MSVRRCNPGLSIHDEKESLVLHVGLTLGSVRLAAAAVRGIAELMYGVDDACQLDVVVAEVGNNIVLHGMGAASNRSEDDTFILRVKVAEDRIILVFEDRGPPFDLTTATPGTPDESIARGGGGLGIYIVHHVMDELAYTRIRGTNSLTLIKYQPTMISDSSAG